MGKLTKQAVDSAATEAGDKFLWDDSLPGFGVRVKKSGLKTFIVQYRNSAGRSRRGAIGRYGVLTLAEARKEAVKTLGDAQKGKRNFHLKLRDKEFTSDISPLLAARRSWNLETAAKVVSENLIEALPGDPWKGEEG